MAMVEWAKAELDRLLAKCEEQEDREMQDIINNNIIEIVEKFANQGHSGFSASYAIGMIKRLLAWKPITPLTGEADEWNDVSRESGYSLQQNNRCSAVFRENNDNSTAYYIEGKIFSDDGGESWYTNSDSRILVTFPFMVPEKPEYILIEPETAHAE